MSCLILEAKYRASSIILRQLERGRERGVGLLGSVVVWSFDDMIVSDSSSFGVMVVLVLSPLGDMRG